MMGRLFIRTWFEMREERERVSANQRRYAIFICEATDLRVYAVRDTHIYIIHMFMRGKRVL